MRLSISLVLALGCLMAFPAERLSGAAESARAEAWAVERFVNDIQKAPIPHRAMRHLEASNSKLNESGWMDAFTEYTREGGFRYRVLSEGGSERIRHRALKGVLDAEQENTAQWRKGALTSDNYEFSFDSRTPDGLIKVQLNPRRRDSRLLDGAAWLSPQAGELVRLEGRLSKSPSFWVRSVSFTRRYVSIHGTMMPAVMESTADVRVAGVFTLSMTYAYAAVDGQNVTSPQILASR